MMKIHKPQRMICFIQAETEGDTLFFVCSFRNFVNIRLILVPDLLPKTYCKLRLNCIPRYIFRVLIQLDQAEELEHTTDWSDIIWHYFDVIVTSLRKKEERKGREKRQ